MKEQLALTDKINQMSPEEVITTLESVKIEIGLKSPMSSAIALIGGLGLFLERYLVKPGLCQRLVNDTELIVAVDNFVPVVGEGILGPIQAGVRLLGHISDIQFDQNNFAPPINPPIPVTYPTVPIENK